MPAPHRVLVIDDVVENREVVADLLGDYGLEVHMAEPEQAHAELERLLPDVAVVDIGMAYEDGTQVVAWARAKWPAMRLVLFTAFAKTNALLALAKEAGADAFIAKPFDAADLYRVVTGTTGEPPPLGPR